MTIDDDRLADIIGLAEREGVGGRIQEEGVKTVAETGVGAAASGVEGLMQQNGAVTCPAVLMLHPPPPVLAAEAQRQATALHDQRVLAGSPGEGTASQAAALAVLRAASVGGGGTDTVVRNDAAGDQAGSAADGREGEDTVQDPVLVHLLKEFQPEFISEFMIGSARCVAASLRRTFCLAGSGVFIYTEFVVRATKT